MDRSLFTIPMIAATLLASAPAPLVRASEPSHSSVAASLHIPPTTWDGPVQAVIRFTIEPQWHLYWSNPGDAGLAPTVRWGLPAGFRADPLLFPTPTKIITDGLLAYGYFNELILVATITPPPGYRPERQDSIHAGIEWLVCKESCVPGATTVSVPCTATGNGLGDAAGMLARFTLTSPVPWSATSGGIPFATASRSGGAVTLHFDPGAHADDFFPDLLEDAVVDHASITVGPGGVSLRAHPSGPSATIARLRGVLISGRTSYAVDLPIHYQN